MNRSLRTGVPEAVGRQAVGDGVSEGYPEMAQWPGLPWVGLLLVLFVLGMGVLIYFAVYGAP